MADETATPVTSVPEGVPQPGQIPGYESPDDQPQKVQADYFGFSETETYFLPDGISYLELSKLNEGDRRKYQNKTNRDLTLNQDKSATMRLAPGDERHTLLMQAITGWNLTRGGKPVPFSAGSEGSNLGQFLSSADPKIIDGIVEKVRDMNPWLVTEDMTEDAILEEIAKLEKDLQKLRDEKEGNVSSGDR